MKIIVTRPVEDGLVLGEKLAELGHEAIIFPLIRIAHRSSIGIPKLAFQMICFTSANGARSVAAKSLNKDIPVLTLGHHSHVAALESGYQNVKAVGGDVGGLVHYVAQHLKFDAGPILYVSGSETSGELEGKLSTAGFEVLRVVTYDAIPENTAELAISIAKADGVLLYSPRTAKLWCTAVRSAGLESRASELIYYCLSHNISGNLPSSWTKMIAAEPNEATLLSLLEQIGEQE